MSSDVKQWWYYLHIVVPARLMRLKQGGSPGGDFWLAVGGRGESERERAAG